MNPAQEVERLAAEIHRQKFPHSSRRAPIVELLYAGHVLTSDWLARQRREGAAEVIEALHYPVQWQGWRLWFQRIGLDPLAFCDRWCVECGKPWPCPTIAALAHPSTDPDG